MTTTFTLQGGPQLQARLHAIGGAPKDMLRDVGLRGVAEAKHIVHRKTGNLGRTIRMGTLTDNYVEIRAGGQSNVGYAVVVEKGSKPHVILPRRRKVLAWGGSRTLGGRLRAGSQATHFARRVDHPGTKPYPYLIPGLEKALTLLGLDRLVQKWNQAA